ncbi:hypothetical protein C8J56DRAFT_1057290 [Mycena floridula]|nr:hypothetical protein C8J56DRAFT_1057290 [Mycena floridula]
MPLEANLLRQVPSVVATGHTRSMPFLQLFTNNDPPLRRDIIAIKESIRIKENDVRTLQGAIVRKEQSIQPLLMRAKTLTAIVEMARIKQITAPLISPPSPQAEASDENSRRLQEELLILTEEVFQHTRDLETMEQRKCEAQAAIQDLQGLLHPLRQFPTELLREIFIACRNIWQSMGHQHIYLPKRPDSPWNLGLVCQSWRQTCIHFPYLWSLINIYAGVPPEFQLQIMLERAGPAPLDIYIGDPEISYGVGTMKLQPNVSVLLPSAPRWKTLHLNMVQDLKGLDAIRSNLPMLEELHIDCTNASCYLAPLTMFEIAPALRKVTIFQPEVIPEGEKLELELPWSTITHYTTDSQLGDDELIVQLQPLSLSVNLVSANLFGISKFAAQAVLQTIVLPSLISLSIMTIDPGVLALLLDKLKAPALTQLAIDCLEEFLDDDQASIGCFIEKSGCDLTSVGFLACFPSISDALEDILHDDKLTSVTDLTICNSSAGLLLFLIDTPDLPKLDSVSIIQDHFVRRFGQSVALDWEKWWTDLFWNMDELLDFLEFRVSSSRCASIGKLQFAAISIALTTAQNDRMQSLLNDGLQYERLF